MTKKKKNNRNWWRRGTQSTTPITLPGTSLLAPTKPIPLHHLVPTLQKMARQATPEEAIAVDDVCYAAMCRWFIKGDRSEIAGFSLLDENRRIIWTYYGGVVGEVHGVVSSSQQATVACIVAKGKPPNLQWHTHPRMTSFWSPTDVNDQCTALETAMSLSPDGELNFLVFDALDWLFRTVRWQDGKINDVLDGSATLGDVSLDWSSYRKWTSVVDVLPLPQIENIITDAEYQSYLDDWLILEQENQNNGGRQWRP